MHRRSGSLKYTAFKNITILCGIGAAIFLTYGIYQYSKTIDKETPRKEGIKTIPVEPAFEQLVDKKSDKREKKLTKLPTAVKQNARNGETKPPNSSQVTVVTMYMNIGKFQKGQQDTYFTPNLYQRWMKVYSVIQNPVVAFFDKVEDLVLFENLRRHVDLHLTNTKAMLVNRTTMWSFSLLDDITTIFHKPNYPKHLPNTVVPEYSCAMHAKYECMQMASKENYFNTRYIAWLDIGLFRAEVEEYIPPIRISLPPNFIDTSIAYTEVSKRNANYKPAAIINANLVWVCGCFFIGEVTKMEQWSKLYMKATEALITNYNLMSTDQQVLYIMYNSGKPKVEIQTYTADGRFNNWFHLGYLCKEQGDKQIEAERNAVQNTA